MTVLFEPRVGIRIDELEDELARAFEYMRRAVLDGFAVVVELDETAVEGQGDVASAALAHGLLGLVRAFALEGRKHGWRVSAISSTADTNAAERVAWTERLADSEEATGTLLRLGGQHLGRVPT
jgi:NAD(P)-dependent dehydrogenase (short-subunit alcohol dehydrogenase family)